MKLYTKILLFMALTGLLPISCMDDQIREEIISPPDYIGFSSTTTRAAIADLSTLKRDGFNVYATSGVTPTGWYKDDGGNSIDGTNYYKYNNQWDFEQAVKWPTIASGYPMHFYAHYPSSPTGLTVSGDFSSGTTIEGLYTVQAVGSQVDLLAAKAKAGVKPATGHLTLSFEHILSKVNFGVIAGQGTMPEILSLQLVNIGDTRTYDFIAGDWMSSLSGNASYYYFDATGGSAIRPFMPSITDETTANAIYADGHDKHLMLMPQTALSWSPQKNVAPTATSGAYISVLYRMSTGIGTDGNGDFHEVGYLDAAFHPDYDAMGGGLTGPLYVKAGFPLPATAGQFTWEKGNSHLYNIVLGAKGSSNGYILDEYYYDETGAITNLQLREIQKEGKKIGDKLQDGTIHVTLDLVQWDDQNGGDISPGTITVTTRNIMISYNAQAQAAKSLSVYALKADGSPDLNASWKLSVPATQSWLKISFDPNAAFAAASTTLEASGSRKVYFISEDNTNTAYREAAFYLNGAKAGNVYQSGNFENLPGVNNTPTTFNTYAGAFWRANETGERIINIAVDGANGGAWTAYVAWRDARWGDSDGITLSVDGLPGTTGTDPNIYTNNPGNAENYTVAGDDLFVSGNASASIPIRFRIGLTSTYTPNMDYPARYAVIVLSYGNNKHQKIYLRQGEDADYLLRNGDPVGAGSDLKNPRTVTRMFSPYNLTADMINVQVDKPGAVPVVNPGQFTDYPSQAGAIFQWGLSDNSSYLRYAWNAYSSEKPANFSADNYSSNYWGMVGANNETCPPGYRRPNDGNTSVADATPTITASELRQSLFQKPVIGHNKTSDIPNSVWGYYADGFFDRRPITNTSVASGTKEVAYIGRLFFNPNTGSDHYNASVFFPAAGQRYTGALTDAGVYGYYWTSSAYNATNGWGFLVRSSDGSSGYYMSKGIGAFVRCVRQP